MVQIARPCDKHVVCPVIEGLFFPDPDSPYANLSSEKPEPAPSPYCILHPASPLCHNPPPPVPDGCRNCCPPNIDCRIIPIPDGSCTGRNCGSDGGVVIGQDGDGNQTMPFYNTAQSCTVECPDGSSFTHTIAAGRFTSTFSQQEADANAASYCEDEANSLLICIITDTLPSACVGDLYGEQIVAEGGVPRATGNAYLWSASGLPPGLDINTVRGNIGGTPTAGGTYNVTVTATDGMNNSRSKTLVIQVIDIVSGPTLTSGSEGWDYGTLTLQANPAGGIWSVYSGSLPGGLNMNANGVITGTPAPGTGGNTFTFGVMYELGDSVCTKNMSIKIWNFDNTSNTFGLGIDIASLNPVITPWVNPAVGSGGKFGPGKFRLIYDPAWIVASGYGSWFYYTPPGLCGPLNYNIAWSGNGAGGNCPGMPQSQLQPVGPIPGASVSDPSFAAAQAAVQGILPGLSMDFDLDAPTDLVGYTGVKPATACSICYDGNWNGGSGCVFNLIQIGQP